MRLNKLVEKSTQSYEDYNFYKVYHALNNFFTVDLSATYLDILKDRLYTGKADGLKRRSSQTVIYYMLNDLVKLMAPIVSFIAEETYEYIPGTKKQSVFLEDFPEVNKEWNNSEVYEDIQHILEVRSDVSKVLEDLRKEKVIGSSLEAAAVITANDKKHNVLKKYEADLNELFIVSSTTLKQGDFKVEAEKASGEKCDRCWNYFPDVNTNPDWPGVCPKCLEAVT
ncbi:MAG: class I tRNA ligase family protein [Bdellovibrionales bacterium]|nr:class I tRNA ligase family protein [Bdellovibrionales bacterium]